MNRHVGIFELPLPIIGRRTDNFNIYAGFEKTDKKRKFRSIENVGDDKHIIFGIDGFHREPYLASIHKWLICPISVSGSNFNPQNTSNIPAVKIFAFLELEQIILVMDGHYL